MKMLTFAVKFNDVCYSALLCILCYVDSAKNRGFFSRKT